MLLPDTDHLADADTFFVGHREVLNDDYEVARTKSRRRKTDTSLQTPLETYLREINETALLSAADEQELAGRIAQGDGAARDRMVRANLRLVVNIARGYSGKGLGLQDLIEEGNLGLLRAVEGFDPHMGTRFSTYASYWIKQSIKRALINSAKTIRIPAYMVELLSKWRRATSRLTEELDRTPTPEEIARVLGLAKKKLPIIKEAIRIHNSTPQTDQSEAGWSLGDMVMDERSKSPDEELLELDALTHVMQLLDRLDPREATVLRMRFGLDDMTPRTLKEIGEQLSLTREQRTADRNRGVGQAGRRPERPPRTPVGERGQSICRRCSTPSMTARVTTWPSTTAEPPRRPCHRPTPIGRVAGCRTGESGNGAARVPFQRAITGGLRPK